MAEPLYEPRYFGDVYPHAITHRPIDDLPRRVVLDANVLMDAALIMDGAGIIALTRLTDLGYQLFTSTGAYFEAKRKLHGFIKRFYSVSNLLDLIIDAFSVRKHKSVTTVNGVSGHDNHVAAAAQELNAFIITEDLGLLLDCNNALVHARTLREILFDIVKPQPGLLTVISGTSFGADGHVFAKLSAHPDVLSSSRKWYFFDTIGLGSLCYDSSSRSFVFQSECGQVVSLPFSPLPEHQFAFLLNYSIGKKMQVDLKACTIGIDDETYKSGSVPSTDQPPSRRAIWLNSKDKLLGWYGHLQVATFGPYQLRKKAWRACSRLIGVAPPTLTADLAFGAAILSGQKKDVMRRLSWSEAIDLASMVAPGFYPGKRKTERSEGWFKNDEVMTDVMGRLAIREFLRGEQPRGARRSS